MGIETTPFICYSHSSYEDMRIVFFSRLQKYLPQAINLVLFTDKIVTPPPPGVRVIFFDESLSYSDRVASCLDQLQEDVCVFHHEDMILYDIPDIVMLNAYIHTVGSGNLDYIKLLKGGETRDIEIPGAYNTLYALPHDYALSFTIQPTIWKVNSLREVYSQATKTTVSGAHAIGNFELLGSEYINKTLIRGAYHYSGEDKRGGNHWNSRVYPHGNFLFKGQWTYGEYKPELDELFDEYSIDPNIRGTV